MDYGYTVTIPTFVLLDSSLAPAERVLYGVLSLMTNSKGYCLATDETLASHVRFNVEGVTKQVSVEWVNKALSKLEELEYIKIESGESRAIVIMFQRTNIQVSVKVKKPSPILEANMDIAEKILAYLSDACMVRGYKKQPFKPTKNNIEHITARLAEGHSYDDFISVINIKMEDTFFQDNLKYMVPQTLFRVSNFDKYLSESAGIKDIQTKVVTKYGLANTRTEPVTTATEGVTF